MADMMDLDNILEDDLMDALSGMTTPSTSITDIPKEEVTLDIDDITIPEPIVNDNVKIETQSVNISSSNSNIDDIASLLKELLNNKTIEITIKIKNN